jgi:hypothetical protein
MLTVEEFLKYGRYICDYYEDKLNKDCSPECPFAKRSLNEKHGFCVFPDLTDVCYDYKFAIKAVEDFKNKMLKEYPSRTYLDILKEKFPKGNINEAVKHCCPLILVDGERAEKCKHKTCMENLKDLSECWNREKKDYIPAHIDSIFD